MSISLPVQHWGPIILLGCLCVFSLPAQTLLTFPLQIRQSLQDGSATLTHSAIDIGTIDAVFDDNPNTLARSANINPMVLTLQFTNPVTTQAFKVIQGFSNGWFTLEAANNLADLNSQSGTYVLLEQQRATLTNGDNGIPVTANHTVTKNVFRLTVRRTTGDNYVHLQDWMIYGVQNIPVNAITALPAQVTLYLNRKINFADFSTSLFRVFAHTAQDSFELAPDALSWSVSNPAVISLDTVAKTIEAIQSGTCDLTGTIGAFSLVIPVTASPLTNEAGPDLGVRFIKRLPEIDYVENSDNPAVEGWPAMGQAITWRAWVRNWSQNGYTSVPFHWQKNGQVVQQGTLDLAPNQETFVDLEETWSFQRDTLVFVLDPTNQLTEFTKKNNSLLIYTNAISLNFYVEQSLYDFFYLHQFHLGVETNSWDDWAQMLHVNRWNTMFAEALYPTSPQGVLDRIRIDSIVIVPDGTLPLAGGLPGNSPNQQDRTVDLQWGFPYSTDALAFYTQWPGSLTEVSDQNPFYFEGSLLHELGHARYLIDTYGLDLTTAQVQIEEDDMPVAGSKYLPIKAWDVVYYNKNQGLMGAGDATTLSPYDAACLNQIAYHRAVCGNWNAPCNIGIFINDLPANNYVTLQDQEGHLLANAQVEVYVAKPLDGWYSKQFDDIPVMSFTTDAGGTCNLGANPFVDPTQSNQIVHGYGYSNMDLIIRVATNDRVGYQVIEATDFNLAYWMGDSLTANYRYEVPMFSIVTATLDPTDTPITVYPNPAHEVLYLSLPASLPDGNLAIYSLTGQRLSILPLQRQIDISALPAGIYYLSLEGEAVSFRIRFVKQ